MYRELTKKGELLLELKDTSDLLHAIPANAPERLSLEHIATYVRQVLADCELEGWKHYYTIKARYSWK